MTVGRGQRVRDDSIGPGALSVVSGPSALTGLRTAADQIQLCRA
jgi:hypothetical protein